MAAAQAHGKKIIQIPQSQQTLPLWSLMLDAHDSGVLPRRFRTTRDPITGHFMATGLDTLNMSGSAQFSVLQLQEILNKLATYGINPDKVIVVDLRGEPHAFINDYPVMWYSSQAWWTFSDPVALVIAKEKDHLDSLSIGQQVSLKRIATKDHQGQPEVIDVFTDQISSLKTEEQVVHAASAHYVRIPVTDHMRPEDKDVDQFLTFVKALPPGVWVHFHCHGGHGRTSTFMIMYDIMRNPTLSLQNILDRQVKIGSMDVRHISGAGKSYKIADQKDRLHFIRLFYQYVHSHDGYGKVSWTNWVMQQNGKSYDRSDENNSYRHPTVATQTRG